MSLDDKQANAVLVTVCRELRARVHSLPDARSRQLISDVLEWAEQNPDEIRYNTKTKKDRLSVMPNIIGFQLVMIGIAAVLRSLGRQASRVVVDQQSQFNKAQKTLANLYLENRGTLLTMGLGLPNIDLKDVPTVPLEFASSTASSGLELSDIYLWIYKRFLEGKIIAPKFQVIGKPHLWRGELTEVSLRRLAKHWMRWFENLPEPTAEQEAKAREIMSEEERRRLRAIGKAATPGSG